MTGIEDPTQTGQAKGSNSYTDWSDASVSSTEAQGWIQEIINASERDVRRQPWKQTFGDTVNCRLDNGEEDLVTIEKGTGGVPDPHCPFKTQGSSLAA